MILYELYGEKHGKHMTNHRNLGCSPFSDTPTSRPNVVKPIPIYPNDPIDKP